MPAANDYHFVTHWTLPDTQVAEVYAILSDVRALPEWWPSVYRAVVPVAPGHPKSGIGATFDLHTKGWLPYTLRWRLTVSESNPPYGSTIRATGDLEGRGIWRFVPQGKDVGIVFDWKIEANKPLLRLLAPLLKPAFAANHRWAMQQGEISLRREILRRRAAKANTQERRTVPPPPGPTTWQPWAALSALVLGFVLTASAVTLITRNKSKSDS